MELADMRDLGSRAERRAGSTPVTRTTSSQASYRLRRLFMLCVKSHLALTPLRLLSKSNQPAAGLQAGFVMAESHIDMLDPFTQAFHAK